MQYKITATESEGRAEIICLQLAQAMHLFDLYTLKTTSSLEHPLHDQNVLCTSKRIKSYEIKPLTDTYLQSYPWSEHDQILYFGDFIFWLHAQGLTKKRICNQWL